VNRAERNTTLRAAASLFGGLLWLKVIVNFVKIRPPLSRRALLWLLLRNGDKFQHLGCHTPSPANKGAADSPRPPKIKQEGKCLLSFQIKRQHYLPILILGPE
jgi:hypothetical protein